MRADADSNEGLISFYCPLPIERLTICSPLKNYVIPHKNTGSPRPEKGNVDDLRKTFDSLPMAQVDRWIWSAHEIYYTR